MQLCGMPLAYHAIVVQAPKPQGNITIYASNYKTVASAHAPYSDAPNTKNQRSRYIKQLCCMQLAVQNCHTNPSFTRGYLGLCSIKYR